MQHFKPVVSNDVSLSGNSFPIVGSHGLWLQSGQSLLIYKAKAHSRYGRDMVGSESWQRQLQEQFHVPF